MNQKQCRVFLGVPVSQELYCGLKKQLFPYRDKLPNGRFILAENAHLTIRFFGDVDCDVIPALWAEIKNKMQDINLFSVMITKIAVFPDKKGELIAAYVEKNTALEKLFLAINTISVEGSHNSEKKYLPHITLYRAKRSILNFPEIALSSCELSVNSLILYESQIVDGKRQYQQLYSMTTC